MPEHDLEVHLDDVETLNRMALAGSFDFTKISFHAYLKLGSEYELLDAGSALGFGCGPLVVSKENLSKDDLANCRVVVPGELTTAHLLLRLWAPCVKDVSFVRYDDIMPMVENGQADAGVIIHEGRFVYEKAGLKMLADLGQWWEDETGLPIPLGCIVARKELGDPIIRGFESLLRKSIENAFARDEKVNDYILQHAQEMDEAVLIEHIDTYVNEFSISLGETGRRAVEKLHQMARHAGVVE